MTNRERMMKEKESPAPTGNKSKEFKTEYVKRSSLFIYPKTGKTIVRLVGDFSKVVTHQLTPNKHLMTKGVAPEDEFGMMDGQIPFNVKCDNFDEKTEVKVAGNCPWDKIHWRAHDMTEWEEDKKVKATLKNVAASTKQTSRWYCNAIDRNDPHYIMKVKVNDKWEEKTVKGNKILALPNKAFQSIMTLMADRKKDLSDPDEGYDIEIIKSGTKQETTYTVSFAMDEEMSAKKSPLTGEERKYTVWNPSEHLYDQYDFNKIYPKLHKTLRDLYEISDEDWKKAKEEHKGKKAVEADSDDSNSGQATEQPASTDFDTPPDDLNPDDLPF